MFQYEVEKMIETTCRKAKESYRLQSTRWGETAKGAKKRSKGGRNSQKGSKLMAISKKLLQER